MTVLCLDECFKDFDCSKMVLQCDQSIELCGKKMILAQSGMRNWLKYCTRYTFFTIADLCTFARCKKIHCEPHLYNGK